MTQYLSDIVGRKQISTAWLHTFVAKPFHLAACQSKK
jgi:hypothetical protein